MVEHRVKRRFKAGQCCGRETEIVVTLPQKDYRRLTRSLGWRSVHWPAERDERPRKLPSTPAKRRTLRRRWKPRKLKPMPVENCSPGREALEPLVVRDPLTLPVALENGPADLFIPASEAAALEKPPAKPRGRPRRPRVPERDRFVEPDVPYVLQTLREMLAIAEQKEAYHAAALRAVQGPRVTQKRRAFAILPLLRKECIRPLQKAIKRLESLEKKQ